MSWIFLFIIFVLGGFLAIGFVVVKWRNKQMPVLLRLVLMVAAISLGLYVLWVIAVLAGVGKMTS